MHAAGKGEERRRLPAQAAVAEEGMSSGSLSLLQVLQLRECQPWERGFWGWCMRCCWWLFIGMHVPGRSEGLHSVGCASGCECSLAGQGAWGQSWLCFFQDQKTKKGKGVRQRCPPGRGMLPGAFCCTVLAVPHSKVYVKLTALRG